MYRDRALAGGVALLAGLRFEFGLQRFLDGVQNLLESRTPDIDRPRSPVDA